MPIRDLQDTLCRNHYFGLVGKIRTIIAITKFREFIQGILNDPKPDAQAELEGLLEAAGIHKSLCMFWENGWGMRVRRVWVGGERGCWGEEDEAGEGTGEHQRRQKHKTNNGHNSSHKLS